MTIHHHTVQADPPPVSPLLQEQLTACQDAIASLEARLQALTKRVQALEKTRARAEPAPVAVQAEARHGVRGSK